MASASIKKTLLQDMLSAVNKEEFPAQIRAFAQQLTDEISTAAPENSEQLLNLLIAELALSAADERRRRERRQKQAKGIAAAKAKGVQFGRRRAPLPDDFDECYQAWRDGELSIRQAAESCGMGRATFRRAVTQIEQNAERTAQ